MPEVSFRGVTKRFAGDVQALDHLDFSVAEGEFMILVGPSGCGKSTALRLLAGLEEPSEGVVTIGGQDVTGLAPRDRDVAMVFQGYALYPHLSVAGNLAFGLRQRHTPKREIEARVSEAATMLELDELLSRKPGQLSGGQRQRVAIGRAIVRRPRAFLLDEPLSNLDAKLRVQMRTELKRIHGLVGTTTLYVTHDQVEAMTLGQRIAVMDRGRLQQVGTPQEVFNHPSNLFVAEFIGSPPMNLLPGHLSGGRVTAGDLTAEAPGYPDGDVTVGLRPEALRLGCAGNGSGLRIEVEMVELLGSANLVYGKASDGSALAVRVGAGVEPKPGECLPLSFSENDLHLFDSRSGKALG